MFKLGKKKPQGATRNTARTSRPEAEGSPLPSWLMLSLGIGIGVFITFMLYLWKPWQPVKRPAPAPVTTNSDTPPTEKDTREPRFDFYRLLPSQKVIAEEPPADGAKPTPSPATTAPKPVARPASTQPDSKPSDTDRQRAEAILEGRKPVNTSKPEAKPARKGAETPNPAEKPDDRPAKPKAADKVKNQEPAKAKPSEKETDAPRYTLQAGSFKSQSEAERRKAKVALSGLPARIQQVKVKEGEVWYRVIVGPFKGKQASDKAQGELRGDGVDSLAIKEKK